MGQKRHCLSQTMGDEMPLKQAKFSAGSAMSLAPSVASGPMPHLGKGTHGKTAASQTLSRTRPVWKHWAADAHMKIVLLLESKAQKENTPEKLSMKKTIQSSLELGSAGNINPLE